MSHSHHTWTITVLEDTSAAIDVDGRQVTPVPRWLLPEGARDGDVLSVTHERSVDSSHLVIELRGR